MSAKKIKTKQQITAADKKKSGSIGSKFDLIVNFKYTGLIIACIYLVALGIISFIYHRVGDYGVETDFFWGYVPGAKKFLSGEMPMDAFRGPFYPVVLGLAGYISGDFFYSGVLIALISASLVIYFTFELLKRLFDPSTSFFVTILLALNPVFIQYSYSAGTDMFFNALAAATLFFFLKNKELSFKNTAIAAFFGGLSYLTRYNGIFLASFVVIILLINYWQVDWGRRVKASLLFIFIFLVTISPWGFYTLAQKGSFFYNENYKNIAFEVYGKGKISWDDFWFKESSKLTSFSQVIFKDTGLFFSTVLNNVADHFSNDMNKLLGWQLGVFVILGIVLLVFSGTLKNRSHRPTAYYIINLFFFGLLLLVFYSERFSLFLIPFYIVLAVYPFFNGKLKIQKFLPQTFRYVLLAGLIIFSFFKSFSFNSGNINSGPVELLTLREWYNDHIPEQQKGKIVAARKAHVAYYLDMDFKLMPMADSYGEFIQKLREENVDYLYFGIAEAGLRRELQFLIDPKSQHPGLDVVVYFTNPPSVLYRLEK